MSAIRFCDVTFEYPHSSPALDGVELDVAEGEVLLVTGASGSGKSTLLRCVNGLVPHASGGRFSGDVQVFGRSTRNGPPRTFADLVGFVHQDPEAQFVVDDVESDVAFVLENLGVDEATMRRRVEEALDALDVAHLRGRSPVTLSGGERQRCAIAGAIAAAPAVLVLDEPTSQLDPQGAEDLLAAVSRLNADLGTTVLLAEHRLDRAASLADRATVVEGGRVLPPGPAADVLAAYPGAPSVTRLGRLLGWQPLPLTVRQARRHPAPALPAPARGETVRGETLVRAVGLAVDLGGRRILSDVDLEVASGDVVALLGRNGAGKTTLLRAIAGLSSVAAGQVRVEGRAAYVPQDPNVLLAAPTARREVERTLRLLGRPDRGEVGRWLSALGLGGVAGRHPRSLSGGERQRLAVAAVAVGGAETLLLDEPTRGMDAPSRTHLERAVLEHASNGGAVILATHDVELAARVATIAIVLGDGEVVAAGPARAVLSGSLFAPQVLRVLPPFLTVEEVEAAVTA